MGEIVSAQMWCLTRVMVSRMMLLQRLSSLQG
jgi:hypothetical protein